MGQPRGCDKRRKNRFFWGLQDPEQCNHLQRIAVEESRLGIPLLFGLDVIHGHRTVFPIPLAESCSFDDEVFAHSVEIAAREASSESVNWTFAPMVDTARDARWERVAEIAGEDPYLTSRYTAVKVRGFQGDNLSDSDRLIACAKHFAAYSAAIGGCDYNFADMSLQTLWNIYLPPFHAACEAGVATLMSAFQNLNGIPCTENRYLLRSVLRERFGFKGFVVSDADSVGECVAHGTAEDRRDAACKVVNAGVNVDIVSDCYLEHME